MYFLHEAGERLRIYWLALVHLNLPKIGQLRSFVGLICLANLLLFIQAEHNLPAGFPAMYSQKPIRSERISLAERAWEALTMEVSRQRQNRTRGVSEICSVRLQHRKDTDMIWKIVSIGLVLWFVQSAFHLTVAMTVLISIVAVTAFVATLLRSSHGLAAVSRKL